MLGFSVELKQPRIPLLTKARAYLAETHKYRAGDTAATILRHKNQVVLELENTV